MSEKKKIRMPDLMESIFDVGYLLFALIAGIRFLICAGDRHLFVLYGILTLTLCFGDSFHLIPRIKRDFFGSTEKIRRELGLGLQISSITMTIFYVILVYVWQNTFPTLKIYRPLVLMIWATAIFRIAICMLPQNDWSGKGNARLSMIRNGLFVFTGAGVTAMYLYSGNTNGLHMTRMAAAIVISFACYLPVTFLAKKKPMIGMLMIPKTCTYIWMIVMGLQLL